MALGSNLGPREAHLDYAVSRLRGVLDQLRASSYVATAPEGVSPHDPEFLNAAVAGWSAEDPVHLLSQIQAIESERGRQRPFVGAPRTLDLDLILVGDLVVNTTTLHVPHPRFRARRFVLEPLSEVAPDVVDPVSGLTIRALLDHLG